MARGHWSAFADFEPLSGDVVIGSLAPITGNAYRYGEETRAASDLAVSHFNEYLEQRGEKWSIKQIHIDTETDPAAALAGLVALDGQNVKLVNGPVIDIITQNVLGYANSNDMVLVSCCSSSPANAIPGDALFRMLPDQRVHAAEIVRLMTAHPALDLEHVVPVGIDNPWATELLGAAKGGFENRGVTFSEIITYDAKLCPRGRLCRRGGDGRGGRGPCRRGAACHRAEQGAQRGSAVRRIRGGASLPKGRRRARRAG